MNSLQGRCYRGKLHFIHCCFCNRFFKVFLEIGAGYLKDDLDSAAEATQNRCWRNIHFWKYETIDLWTEISMHASVQRGQGARKRRVEGGGGNKHRYGRGNDIIEDSNAENRCGDTKGRFTDMKKKQDETNEK